MNFIDRTTPVSELKASLDLSVQRTRMIADRIACASAGQRGFSLPAGAGDAGAADAAAVDDGAVDIEVEMVRLADEQLRYEATAKLLEKTYAGLRASLQGQ